MLTPVEMNWAVLPGSGGNGWWEDWSRLIILDADTTKALPLNQIGTKDNFELD
jgi:hypothetical protein